METAHPFCPVSVVRIDYCSKRAVIGGCSVRGVSLLVTSFGE
jgi:hypothetical protein